METALNTGSKGYIVAPGSKLPVGVVDSKMIGSKLAVGGATKQMN